MKTVPFLLLLLFLPLLMHGQTSEARLPLTLLQPVADAYIPATVYPLPDWEAALKRGAAQEAEGLSAPFSAGLPIAADISFPASGTWTVLPDGRQIWRTRVAVNDAPALGLYYDRFELPQGAALFVSNENGRQILGAYTSRNNGEDGRFAHEAVQGSLVNLELDLEPGVQPASVHLHVDRILVYFRSYEYLNQYLVTGAAKPTDVDDLHLEGSGALCNINAICPLGVNYSVARKATVQTIYPNGDLCSATMVNNTGNTTADCKSYLLTATHCDEGNSTGATPFSQLLIRFNFETKQCTGGPPAEVNTLTGAYFRARSNYVAANPPSINGDFLLLELKDKIPANWDVYLAGWNHAETMPDTLSYPKRYIAFHHPAGDVKKIVAGFVLSANGDGGGSMGAGTHWELFPIDSGGIEGGSSGSGLFDGEGRLIGITSVAGGPDPACTVTGKPGGVANFYTYVEYSKLSLDWDYMLDGTDNSRKLRPWLDPLNTGAMTLDAVKSDCSTTGSGISIRDQALDDAIAVAPNPVVRDQIRVTVHFDAPTGLLLNLYSLSGRRQAAYDIGRIQNGTFAIPTDNLVSGMYLLKFNTGRAVITKKVMIVR